MLWALSFIALAGVVVYIFSGYRKFSKRQHLHDHENAALNKIDDELKQYYGDIVTLEKLASIYERAEKARSGPFFPTMPDAHYGSKRWRREQKEIEQAERDDLNRALRKIYFSVSDVNLRKQLIAKNREISRLHVKWIRQNVSVAKASGNTDEVKNAETDLAKALEEPFLFSQEEEWTGKPQTGDGNAGATEPL